MPAKRLRINIPSRRPCCYSRTRRGHGGWRDMFIRSCWHPFSLASGPEVPAPSKPADADVVFAKSGKKHIGIGGFSAGHFVFAMILFVTRAVLLHQLQVSVHNLDAVLATGDGGVFNDTLPGFLCRDEIWLEGLNLNQKCAARYVQTVICRGDSNTGCTVQVRGIQK